MIIRSQNKKTIRNFNLISDLFISKDEKGGWEIIACYPYYAQSDCGFAVIGTYSTEEKAIKALDMICEQYMKNQALYIDRENNARVIPQNSVFHMPADEDVEV